ncbi:MAG: rRNA maturation RNase YbeY [Alphaproteobacteria bacterium]|nr:rRNA maturation RNase YbeY [Alphaproteobacteria bacterium]
MTADTSDGGTVDLAIEDGVEVDADQLQHDVEGLLAALGLDDPELSVLVTDDAGIQALNAQWRHKDEPTDVLSFPQQEAPVVGGLLGDLVVSVDTAARQAAEHGHDLRTELVVLVAHGLCHLVGHDHETPEDAGAMLAAERALLTALVGADVAAGLVERAGVAG